MCIMATPPLDLGLSASTGKRVMVFISGPAELSDDAARLVTINNVGTVDILVYALDETIPIQYRMQGASFEVKKRNLVDHSRQSGAVPTVAKIQRSLIRSRDSRQVRVSLSFPPLRC